MQTISAERVHETLHFPTFVDTLEEAFGGDYTLPPRQVMELDPGAGTSNAFATLPAWTDEVIALKSFTYFPHNQHPDLTVYAEILLFERQSGKPLALVDGTSVTYWRTAGVSALASRLLSREDSEELLLLNTGRLAAYLVRAHASVRPIKRVRLWGRNHAKAAGLAATLSRQLPELEIAAVPQIEAGCTTADILVCATNSPDVLVHGEWIKPGTHTDFLGNHHHDRRECDSELIANSRVWVDSRVDCLREAGEILLPIAEGAIEENHILGDLGQLCRGEAPRRDSDRERTLFKAVGCAVGDLAGARAVWEACR